MHSVVRAVSLGGARARQNHLHSPPSLTNDEHGQGPGGRLLVRQDGGRVTGGHGNGRGWGLGRGGSGRVGHGRARGVSFCWPAAPAQMKRVRAGRGGGGPCSHLTLSSNLSPSGCAPPHNAHTHARRPPLPLLIPTCWTPKRLGTRAAERGATPAARAAAQASPSLVKTLQQRVTLPLPLPLLPPSPPPHPPLLPPQVRPLARRLGGRRTGPHPGRVWRASLAAGDRPPAALAVG